MATEKVFISVEVETGKAVTDLSKIRSEMQKLRLRNNELNKAFKEGKLSQDAYGKAVAKNDVALKRLSGNYREATNAASGLTKEGLRFRDKIAGSLTKSLAKVGAAVAGAFAARAVLQGIGKMVNIVRDFEQANADLASVLGVTTEETEKLTNQQLQLGATTVFTAAEIAGLQKELAKLGFTQEEIIASTEAIQQLAAATNTDLAQAASVAASTVKGFSLTADETQRVVDVMAKSFSSSALDMEKFSTAMAIVAPVAKNAGFTIEETTAQLGILADRGVDASTAATSLRNIFLENSKAGRTFEEGLQLIQKSTDKTKTAFELFGKRGATVATILAENSDQAALLTDSLDNAGGAAQEMADTQLDTLNGQLKLLNSAWEGFILSLEKGDGLMARVARGGIELLSNALTQLTNIGAITEVMFNGIEGASLDARKAMLSNADALNVTLESGMALSEVLEPFAKQTLPELEENLNQNRLQFLQVAIAQGESATEANILFNAYLSLRRETEKSMFVLDEETEAINENIDAKSELVEVETDLIKLKQQEIKDRQAIAAATEDELAIKNTELEALKKELKALQDLRVERDKFHFQRLEHTEDTLKAIEDVEDASELAFTAEHQRLANELAIREFFESEKYRITSEGLMAAQNLTNVFTDNKLRELDREAKEELRVINERERAGLLLRDEAEQERRKLADETDKKAEALEKKAFQRNKAFNIAGATADTAAAVAKALASSPPPVSYVQAGITAALGAAEIATISAQKFAKGGIIEGASHDQGGVPIMGGRAEVEGGEVILTKGVTDNPSLLAAASQLNVMGGGKSFFQDGGVLPFNFPTFDVPSTDNTSAILAAISEIEFRPVVAVDEINSAQSNVAVTESIATV